MIKGFILFVGLFGVIGGLYFFLKMSTKEEIISAAKAVFIVAVVAGLAAIGVNVATELKF